MISYGLWSDLIYELLQEEARNSMGKLLVCTLMKYSIGQLFDDGKLRR